jgi:predicted nucleic acid-binding protein
MVKAVRSMLDGLGERPMLAVDIAPIIHWLEGHPRLANRFASVFSAVESGAATIVISTVTLAEVLAGPLRAANELLTGQYREALTRSSGWRVMAFDADLAVDAARMRAVYRLRLPDAMLVATAIRAGAAALVTHDRAFRKVRGLRVLGPE